MLGCAMALSILTLHAVPTLRALTPLTNPFSKEEEEGGERGGPLLRASTS